MARDKPTIWRHLVRISTLIIALTLIHFVINPPEETNHLYEDYENYIFPESAHIVSYLREIIGNQTLTYYEVPEIIKNISTNINLTNNRTTSSYDTIKSKSGNSDSIVLLEYSLLHSLRPYLLIVDFSNGTFTDDEHLSLLIVSNTSKILISDPLIQKENTNFFYHYMEPNEFFYELTIYTNISKYEIKHSFNDYEQRAFDDNLEFINWLHNK